MKTKISETPASEAALYISSKLTAHADTAILLLLSGGSALSILDELNVGVFGPHITVAMADERFVHSEEGNNFLQLQQTDFCKNASAHGVNFIESVPHIGESHTAFAQRIRAAFENYLQSNPNNYALGVFGIGEDGHTAGIFPLPENDFNQTYMTDELYVPVAISRQAYPLRTSVTPAFIEEACDDVVLYAVGTNKCDNILDYMYNKNFAHHEIPALVPASHPQGILFTDCPTLIP